MFFVVEKVNIQADFNWRLQFLLLWTGTDQQEGSLLVHCQNHNQEEVDNQNHNC